MKSFFVILVSALLLIAAPAYAGEEGQTTGVTSIDNCKTGCGHAKAPGVGTGQSICWVTFIAADGYADFKAQIMSPEGVGLLKNAKGEIAIRGGERTTRISVDCDAIRLGEKLVTCFTHEGKPVTRTIKGAMFKGFLPESHTKGGIEVQL